MQRGHIPGSPIPARFRDPKAIRCRGLSGSMRHGPFARRVPIAQPIRRSPARLPPQANRDINLDIGEQVPVDGWNADGTARVTYRGSSWNARYIGDGPAAPGLHVIVEMRHNELALRRAA